ncbi:universal stress protein [Streptomyces himalayensis]|uniref:Universal stress protein n=1 Tax=Streptomyces himalayensis subsp. himalayensis TaxID=2756131 RepID=A0A7W0DM09_9ACTN|nr:universal stress protein [Streptomyces himalayensis]MBA2947506.1 universal stress protein [Streptomyces himalayensis subsp. himalayensis]
MSTLPVIAAVDGSEDSLRALEWALSEARLRDAPLRVVHVRQYTEWTRPGAMVVMPLPPAPQGDQVVDQVRASLAGREGLPPVEYLTLDGAPSVVLPELSSNAQLIVLGSRGRGGFASLLLGSNGIATARDAACPVVVVPRPGREVHGEAAGPAEPGPRIVIGVSADSPDTQALAFAFEAAARRSARLQVVSAYPWPVYAWSVPTDFAAMSLVDKDAVEADTHRLLNDVLAAHRKEHPDVRVDVSVLGGDAAGHVVAASKDADLVAVGRHRRRLLQPARMLGSVTHAVLLHAASPVAVVPPAAEDGD